MCVRVCPQTNKWTAAFFAMQAEQLEILDYLLRTGRVDLKHEDVVSTCTCTPPGENVCEGGGGGGGGGDGCRKSHPPFCK